MSSAFDLVVATRVGYLGAASAVLLIFALPPLRSRFLAYGARSASSSRSSVTKSSESAQPSEKQTGLSPSSQKPFHALLDVAASIKVPHNWFTSFYAVSVVCSLYWLSELVTKGPVIQWIADSTHLQSGSMSFFQLRTTWVMMFVQGSRRLYECLAISRSSTSQMWIGHWILGVGFYLVTSFAIWIEGIPILKAHQYSTRDIAIVAPSIRSFVGILIFILASGFQHDCHAYLASLKCSTESTEATMGNTHYRLPSHPAFHSLIAPHYTAECLIYASLALVAAPSGAWINNTLLCALVFVAANLGVTAHMTKQWYEMQFGKDAVAGRWKLIPKVF